MDFLESYKKAGKIASQSRENARKKNHVGSSLFDICENIENEIRQNGGQPAFPVNVSLNNIAAHYTAEPSDTTIVNDGDVLKIDIGVHINGYIADTAVTVCYNSEYDALVKATEHTLCEALKITRTSTKSGDIGKIIENTISNYGFLPIKNLSGHSLEQYTIHAGKSIPNIDSFGSFKLESNQAYAIEPFVTLKEGLGIVHEGKIANIFALVSRKPTKDKKTDQCLNLIWNRFKSLPFALRWILNEYEENEAREMFNILRKRKNIHAYPILVEGNGKMVAQAEHTIIPNETGVDIITL